MNAYLTRLGIPLEIQAFFKAEEELYFEYGDAREYFGDGFHYVPTTHNLWLAGDETATEVIVTHSAMEAIAFLTINRLRYLKPEQLLFIAIGNRLHDEQSGWIRQHFRKRRFSLAFGNDLTGHITDIKFTAALKNFNVLFFYGRHHLTVQRQEQVRVFKEDQISLHHFRLAFGIRANIRTRKSTLALTFLDQLKNDTIR